MKNHKSYNTRNPFQLFANAFTLLLSRIEHILYLSIPTNLLKYLLFAIVTGFLSSLQRASIGTFLWVAIFFVAVYVINSYVTLIYSLFLIDKNASLSQSVQNGKKVFQTILSSDILFLGISLFVYIPFILISHLSWPEIPMETSPLSTVHMTVYIALGCLWFLCIFIPYHSSIRLFLLNTDTPMLQVWKKGYKKYFQNFLWIFVYYFCFGFLYILFSRNLSNYFLFELLMVVIIPFQSAIDVISYNTLLSVEEEKEGILSRRNPDEGS
ncbi:MAG: hypothetical protein PHI40_03365 [Caldisericia bacterium]|nr:hypothetical protein [Caldisericia bacterium]MDD4614432.1 hypothetical protein [Caldisericia bacterium]